MEETTKGFNHEKGGVADRISMVGELEHARRHALRSAAVLAIEEKPVESFKFLVWAKQLQDLRRKYMGKYFSDIDTKHWCLCKSTACLRQLAYEIEGADSEFLVPIENLVDEVWGDAIGKDLSDCESCVDDKKAGEEE